MAGLALGATAYRPALRYAGVAAGQRFRDGPASALSWARGSLLSEEMPSLELAPGFSWISALSMPPLRPLHTLVRTAEERFRPARILPHRSISAAPGGATILREAGAGRTPTLVLGGFVPDATEQVFLLRRFLLRSGDLYYLNYPRDQFSLDALCAQLDELVGELAAAGQPPVVFGVSFGAGVLIEWLRRARVAGRSPALAGVVLVSPVTCLADIIAPGAAKPATLIGRALRPYLDPAGVPESAVEKSRAIFLRMFDAGAQNKLALRLLMTERETERLHAAVVATIRGVTGPGACARVAALGTMLPPTGYFSPRLLPLAEAPTLILFAEREDAVLDEAAPVRFALERAPRAYFPQAALQCVRGRAGQSGVQHASLVFHVFEFLPPIHSFYQRVRRQSLAFAA